MTVPVLPLHDKLVWCDSKDGELTAKQAYNYLFPPQKPVTWAPVPHLLFCAAPMDLARFSAKYRLRLHERDLAV
ncbi:hypothetical protein A2U01_0034361 [Trifolium medium]|uniref:Uncharacterized protein n=1 Tax=Trifolium medium TaxID=97028 RepID=A0A392PQP9_9FABA|nr:hypothetical protein [Trifolium medium]